MTKQDKKEKKPKPLKPINKKQSAALQKLAQGEVLFDEPMSKHTSIRIGGPAEVFLRPASKEDIIDVMAFLHEERINYFALGRGSNLIVGDKGMPGLVIAMKFGLDYLKIKGEDVLVGASYDWPKLTLETIKKGLRGLEPTAGIPATAGGALAMNAGAYGTEVFDYLKEVEIVREGVPIKLKKNDIEHGYRNTSLSNDLILEVNLGLSKGHDPERLKEERYMLLTKRSEQQPLNKPCVGSVFKNPEGNFAGKLIMDSGLSGKFIGNVQISPKHANFIVNTGGGTAKDMMKLIKYAIDQVKKDSDITLEMEVKQVGEGF